MSKAQEDVRSRDTRFASLCTQSLSEASGIAANLEGIGANAGRTTEDLLSVLEAAKSSIDCFDA